MTRSTTRRVWRLRRLVVILGGLLVLPAACTAWLLLSPQDPTRFASALDALPVPASWEVVRTYTQRDFLMGSRADRYYLVDADPGNVVPVLKDAMRAAGFEIYIRAAAADWCDPHPLDSIVVPCPTKVIADCRENGAAGSADCNVEAFRRIAADPAHLEHLYASLSRRGSTIDYGPGASPRYVTDPNRALVVISADLSYPRYFWASPTPIPSGAQPSP